MRDNDVRIEEATAQAEAERLREEARLAADPGPVLNRRRQSMKPEPNVMPKESVVKKAKPEAIALPNLDEDDDLDAPEQVMPSAAERKEVSDGVLSNNVALGAVAALSFAATNPMHSLGNVKLGDGAPSLGGKWGKGGNSGDAKLRFRMNFMAMTSPKVISMRILPHSP